VDALASDEVHRCKPVQIAMVMASLKRARTTNSNALHAVAVVSYLMTTMARKK
jgi:hypothetical protein